MLLMFLTLIIPSPGLVLMPGKTIHIQNSKINCIPRNNYLSTITKLQPKSPKLIVKLSDGTQIAHEEPGRNLIWDN